MSQERNRAFRRAQLKRLKNKTKKIAKRFPFGKTKDEQNKWAEDWANRNANNRQACSCTACGNPRRHFDQLTMQELRAVDVDDFEATPKELEAEDNYRLEQIESDF